MGACKIFLTLILFSGTILIAAQSGTRRCYQFTWLGPRFTNESEFLNATCLDATRLTAGIPCRQPLVASFDGSWPDVAYIWTHHLEAASCVLTDTDVCATYTYYFNGHAENSTYMCTRAVDSNGVAIRSGCFTQSNGSYVTRACFCRSLPDGVPCNHATISATLSLSIFIVLVAITTNINTLSNVFK